MATNRMPVGNGPATGAEFTLTAPAGVFLTSGGGAKVAPKACIELWIKNSTNTFSYFASLTGSEPSGVLPAGTFRGERIEGTAGLEQA